MKKAAVWARAPVGAAVTLALLLAMVSLGMQVPGLARVPVKAGDGPDYGPPPSAAFTPLRDSFVEQIVGNSDPLGFRGTGHLDGEFDRLSAHGGQKVEHGMVNDARADAYEVKGVPFTARTHTDGASREEGEPAGCAPVGGTVWYRYTPRTGAGIVATTAAATPVALAVFASGSDGAIGCDSDTEGRGRVRFHAAAGTTYLFQITMQVGGPLVFALDREPLTMVVSGTGDVPAGASFHFGYPDTSGDGRYVAFLSGSEKLDPKCAARRDGSFPCGVQVYVRDLVTGETELVSLSENDGIPNEASLSPSISHDGRYIAFTTRADNVVKGDEVDPATKDREFDVFVRDRVRDRTIRVTVNNDGTELSGSGPVISADGRYVAWESVWEHRRHDNEYSAAGLVEIYWKDLVTGRVLRASRGHDGAESNNNNTAARISPDGRYVTFMSKSTTFGGAGATDDTFNTAGVQQWRLFTFDAKRGHLSPECVAEDNETYANDACWGHAISRDGRYSAFFSLATNLIDDLPPAPSGGNAVVYAYRRDRMTGELDIVTVANDGRPVAEVWRRSIACMSSRNATVTISDDGSIVAFDTTAALVGGDEPDNTAETAQSDALCRRRKNIDAYVRDVDGERTILVSAGVDGASGNDPSEFPSVSADGSVVSFITEADNIVPNDDNEGHDVFARAWRGR